MKWVSAIMLCLWAASVARGQFDSPGATEIRQRVAGALTAVDGGPTPVAGDQIGAFANNAIVGSFTFTTESAATGEFEMIVYGDEEGTEIVEGAAQGEQIEFRFYDDSANITYLKLGIRNASGERFNYKYAGQMVPPFEIPGFPIELLVPTQGLDLVVTSNTSDSGGASNDSGSDGGGGPTVNYDVDGDGKVTTRDAALVLRIVSGSATVPAEQLQRADVNGDQVVSTEDAISVLRNR